MTGGATESLFDKMNWRTSEAATDQLQIQFGKQMTYGQSRGLVRFPDLRRDSDLVIAADYSGEHQSSKYQILTFLLADRIGVLSEWENKRIKRTRASIELNDQLWAETTSRFKHSAAVIFNSRKKIGVA